MRHSMVCAQLTTLAIIPLIGCGTGVNGGDGVQATAIDTFDRGTGAPNCNRGN